MIEFGWDIPNVDYINGVFNLDGFYLSPFEDTKSKRKEGISMGKLEKESYEGKKYHFRYYRKSVYHPFLVALVIESEVNGKVYLSGFNMTRSIEMVLKDPEKFIRIENPNPNDDAPCFVCVDPIKNKPLKLFTRPIRDWELSDNDEKAIDYLVKNKLD